MFPISSIAPLNPTQRLYFNKQNTLLTTLSKPPLTFELQQRKQMIKRKASIAALEKGASHQK
jgi:hypothetical protein